jgi:hypothetical protein
MLGTEVVTPDALVVATGTVTEGPGAATPLAELVTPAGLVTAVVPVVGPGIVLARAPVVAPTPTTSAPSDQFDIRRRRLSPLSRTNFAEFPFVSRLDPRIGASL